MGGNLWKWCKKRDAQSGKWLAYDSIFPPGNPIVKSKLVSIHIDAQKRLFFSSEGRGFFVYDYETDTFVNKSEKDGLPNNVIYGILDDSLGNLWLSCNKGIVCLDKNFQMLKTYTQEDGLQSNQFNFKSSYHSQVGRFYFGGINGFNSFFPNALLERNNTIVPNVEITQIKLLGNIELDIEQRLQCLLKRTDEVVIPYNQSSFSLSYVSLSYISAKKNQYAYRLLGVDNSWIYANNTQEVTYLNLSPGEYVFQVKASNNDGVWNDIGAHLNIKILPPFWLTIYAKIFYCLLFLLLLFLIWKVYYEKQERKHKKILEDYRLQQDALAFKSKINFFTVIAHEIRTPISLICAPLEDIIYSNDGNERTKHNLSIIQRSCNQLNVLIKQLLDFNRMDAKDYMINPQKINLVNFVINLYESFQITARKKGITFEIKTPNEVIEVITDSDALTRIVSNLISNAFKYTKDKIVLTLTVDSSNLYIIKVEDNGEVIPKEYLDLIFNPFFQIENNKDKIEGVGMGLALVKHLSERLKGNIAVYNLTPSGVLFQFTFADLELNLNPSGEKKEIVIENKEDITYQTDTLCFSIEKKTLLIVDDNVDLVLYLVSSLTDRYTVHIANNAEKALKLLEGDFFYDLIISDIMMPGIDGISFTKTIKSDPNYSHLPILLLSAKTDANTKVEGLRSGADLFIEKPFSIVYLKAQIESIFNNRKKLLDYFNTTPFVRSSTLVSSKLDKEFFDKLDVEIERHIAEANFSIEQLSGILGVSRSNLQRKIKNVCGVTPNEYLRNCRLKRACQLLLGKDIRINEVAYQVGFSSASYFTKVFTKVYDMSPTDYIAKHK